VHACRFQSSHHAYAAVQQLSTQALYIYKYIRYAWLYTYSNNGGARRTLEEPWAAKARLHTDRDRWVVLPKCVVNAPHCYMHASILDVEVVRVQKRGSRGSEVGRLIDREDRKSSTLLYYE
jgi:hypothetical protein